MQMRLGATWRDAVDLVFDGPRAGVHFSYRVDHLYPDDDAFDALPAHYRAISLRFPLDLAPRYFSRWPGLLDDIAPGGAARRWWIRHLGLGPLDDVEQRFILLRDATIAPVGNLRIKESVEHLTSEGEDLMFPLESVLEREYHFLDHAQLQGASIGGSTGAGGEAPKMLLRVHSVHGREDEVWIDALQERQSSDLHYLVKFPRRTKHPREGGGEARSTERDRTILVSEHVYYRALDALGVDTMDVAKMHLRTSSIGTPSLWLPRFDVHWRDGSECRLGMESLYAVTDTPPGAQRDHQRYLDSLFRCLVDGEFMGEDEPRRDAVRTSLGTSLVVEYIRRDLLNILFGNSDNHGRNTAVLKSPERVWLAPVYDFAPMVMDLDGVARSTRWNRQLETGRGIDWRGVCEAQAHLADPDDVWTQVRAFATSLQDLDQRLESLGLPEETLTFPSMGLIHTNDKLRAWDLLSRGPTR